MRTRGLGLGLGLGFGLLFGVGFGWARAHADASAALKDGVIARRELLAVLDGQPGRFLQRVTPEAQFVKGRFYGWRLQSFFPGDTRFQATDVHAGDIVLRVNGSSMERPEQLIEVWQALRRAKELVVEIDRKGTGKRLRWAIAD